MPDPKPARAKFRVAQVNAPEGGVKSLTLVTAQQGGSVENQAFFATAPNGQPMVGGSSMNLNGLAPEVEALFVPGREFFVDFTPAN